MKISQIVEARYHKQRSFVDVARAYKEEKDNANRDVFIYHIKIFSDSMISADIVVRDATLSEEQAKAAVAEFLDSKNLPYDGIIMPEQMRTYWKFTSTLSGPKTYYGHRTMQ